MPASFGTGGGPASPGVRDSRGAGAASSAPRDDTSERRQQREIAEARRLLTQFRERQRRLPKEVAATQPAKPTPSRKRRR